MLTVKELVELYKDCDLPVRLTTLSVADWAQVEHGTRERSFIFPRPQAVSVGLHDFVCTDWWSIKNAEDEEVALVWLIDLDYEESWLPRETTPLEPFKPVGGAK